MVGQILRRMRMIDRSRAPWARWTGLVASIVALSSVPSTVVAQEMEIPIAVQIPLFFKVISFDRQLHSRGKTEYVVAVAFQSGSRVSVLARDEAVHAVEAAHETIAGLPVRVLTIDLDHESLGDALKDRQAALLYVTPLRGVDVAALAATAAASGVTAVSGVPRYIALGLAVGVRTFPV
jgi:hypothetical protein